jgi:hypothetical protein
MKFQGNADLALGLLELREKGPVRQSVLFCYRVFNKRHAYLKFLADFGELMN